jgi:molecular chaperone DnaJ
MPQKKDYYKIMEVDKNATAEDIKKAYRKLVKQWHPDKHLENKHVAETKFKEIQEAYEVLGDPEKRKLYDRFGFIPDGGMPGNGRNQTGGFEDIFKDFFGGGFAESDAGSPFSDFFDMFTGGTSSRGRTRSSNPPVRGEDIRVYVTLDLKDVLYDTKKLIEYTRTKSCDSCNGNGSENGTSFSTCPRCNGVGQIKEEQRTFLGVFVKTSVCHTCGGQGRIIEKRCDKCSGSGKLHKKERLEVTIPSGIEDGYSLRIREKGHAGKNGGPDGDLILHLRINENSTFVRKGADLETQISIDYVLAALGGKIIIPTLEGDLTEKIPEGTNPGTVLRIKNYGLPNYTGRKRGDLYVKINVEIPKPNSKEKKYLKEIAKEKKLVI